MKYDQLIDAVGSNGRFQKQLYVLLFLATIPNGLTTLLTVFTQYAPPHYCNFAKENVTINESRMETMKDLLIPKKNGVYDCCKMYNVSFDQIMEMWNNKNLEEVNITDLPEIRCPNGYYYERDHPNVESAVTEFNMVCDRAWMKPLMTSLYMAGMGIGSLSGKLSDIFGRRPLFLVFTYSCFLAVGLNGIAWNIVSYAFFMFFAGVSQLVNFVVAFVISCEFMNVDDRNSMSLGPFIAFSVGYTLSALMGYLLLNWRWLLIANGLIGILYIPYIWLIPESPRWLITKGRMIEAAKILKKVARVNGRNVDVEQLLNSGISLEEKVVDDVAVKTAQNETLSRLLHSDLLRDRFFVCCSAWFVTSLVYYTISLNTSALDGNRFINCLLVAAVEIPAYIIGYLCVKFCGRPLAQSVLMVIAGVCCMTAPFLSVVHPTLTIVVAMIGKFAITSEFFIVYIYFAELSPTLLRNLCVGLGSFSARISGFIAPYLIFAGESIHKSIPFLMMGSLALFTAFLTVFILPETRGVPLPDTCEQAKENKRYLHPWIKSTANKREVNEELI